MNNTELVQSYRQQINNTLNQFNLQLFWNMYNRCRSARAYERAGVLIKEPQLTADVSFSAGGTWK